MDNFLSDRSQSVVVNGTKSAPAPVLSGVPQGSVLGPVLFLSYINDIVEAASSEVRLFADDCVCYRVIENHNDCSELQRDITHLAQWAKTWVMRLQSVMLCLLLGNIIPEFLSILSMGLI